MVKINKRKKFKSKIFDDNRGSLKVNFEDNNISFKESFSKENVFRGMHIQIPPFEQTKYIWVNKGSIIQFLINMDKNRKSFGELKFFFVNSDSGIIKISKNLAHGFLCLEPTNFNYVCDGEYNSEYEKIIKIKNEIFLELGYKKIITSHKDKNGMSIKQAANLFKKINWNINK
tara:strand:- start:70 stop:588 length:519 start_codon:yes stop_codon:yes gene_type:complete